MKTRARIALLSEHASPIAVLGGEDSGGQNVYVDEISRNLASLGYSVDVFVRRDNRDVPEIVDWAPGVRVVHLNAGPPEFLLKDRLWDFMPEFRDAFIRFAQRDDKAYHLVHGNFWMSGWVAAELGERLGIPSVQIFHALGKTKQRHQGKMDTSPRGRINVEAEIVRRVDRVIAQCPCEHDELVNDYGADPRRISIVPSGVNHERFRPVDRNVARDRLGIDRDAFVISYVGRMLPRKDIRNLVKAEAILSRQIDRPVKVLIVGGTTEEPDPVATPEIGELQRIARELGTLDHLIFTGCRQPDELRYYYSAGDVAVTTPWYEPFGLTPLEAMACGVPVIGSAVGGITFTIDANETGLLVPPRDPEALASALRYLLENPEHRQRMGRQARLRVTSEFTWPVTAEKTAAVYRQLIDQRVVAAVGRADVDYAVYTHMDDGGGC